MYNIRNRHSVPAFDARRSTWVSTSLAGSSAGFRRNHGEVASLHWLPGASTKTGEPGGNGARPPFSEEELARIGEHLTELRL